MAGELVSWGVGYGPRTEAYLLRPAGVTDPLPGVVALHDHGGFKFFGKEKIADGTDPLPDVLTPFRDIYYGGQAHPNALWDFPAAERARRCCKRHVKLSGPLSLSA